MSASYGRSAHIDDTDPRFIFRGNWTTKATAETWGISGSPFNLTLHESGTGGEVIFRFKNGKSFSLPAPIFKYWTRIDADVCVAAQYFSLYGNIDTVNNRPAPYWYCALDGVIGNRTEAPGGARRSHFSFCKAPISDGGEHQITLNITVPFGGIVEIDAIEVAPSKDVELTEGEILQVQDTDPAVLFQPANAWEVASEAGSHDTDTYGASVQFNFTGIGVQVYTVNQGSRPTNPVVYTIDDGLPKNAKIPAVDATSYNYMLIDEQNLSNGNHSLSVTFMGEQGKAPLAVGSFVVTLPPASGSSPIVSNAEIVELPVQGAPLKRSKAGAIAGGVVGGVAGFALIVLAFFLWHRYRLRRQADADNSTTASITPFVEDKLPESGPSSPASPTARVHPPASTFSHGESGDGKPGSGPIVLSYEPGRVEVLHEDSGYRAGNPSTSRGQEPLQVREVPPSYSEV